MLAEFQAPTRIVSGTGSLRRLPAELATLGTRPIVVADRGISEAGLLQRIMAGIEPSTVAAVVLVDPDPDVAAVEAHAAVARASAADCVLGVGGGSALGAAKAVSIRLTNDERIDAYLGDDHVPDTAAPVLAVPTTAGSGSEVSMALVLHEPSRAAEMAIRSPACRPRVAILDATVLRDLPWAPLVHAALDGLSHAVESTWARRSTFFTEALALRAATAIVQTLPIVVDGIVSGRNARGENDDALQRLLEASCAANLACGNSGLALIHALSAAPSAHIEHGLQNGILLPHVAAFNAPVTSTDMARVLDELPALYDSIAFTPRYAGGAVGADKAAAMIAASRRHPFRLNNRRDSTDDDLRAILREAGAITLAGAA